MFGGYGDGGGGPMNAAAMGGGFPMRFHEQYHCYPVSFQEKEHLEDGDKILLPSSALDTLARLHVEYPMLFQISGPDGRKTHCGVLEFSAPEGSCYIPYWIMNNLLLEAGSLLDVKNVSLPKATYVKFQPQSMDFLDISNQRAVLEKALRNFSCLTKGDIICIPYDGTKYYLEVKEVKPADAACIIETDCNVDFDAPLGFDPAIHNAMGGLKKDGEEDRGAAANGAPGGGALALPKPQSARASPATPGEGEDGRKAFVPFEGAGARVDGKKLPPAPPQVASDARAAALAAAEKRAEAAKAAASTSGGADSGAAAQARPLTGIKRSGSKWAKKKPATGAFQGSGNSLG